MNRPADPDTPPPIPPACAPTVDRIQAVLDGVSAPDVLLADPHPSACASCAGRVRAARLLASALSEPARPVTVPPGLTTAILAGVRADRRARARRRVFALTAGLATAAAVLVAVWTQSRRTDRPPVSDPRPPEIAAGPVAPPTPAPPAPRLHDELARAGDALRDSSRTLAGPVASGPVVVTALTDSLLKAAPVIAPGDPGPGDEALARLPDAAKTGLEPVTGSAQKAVARLLRDIGAIQPKSKS